MKNVEILGFAPSTYVRTARLVCEEKGIEHSLVPLEFQQESHRALHPYLRMPAMRHGDIVLFETLAIAVYLNEEFPGPDLEAGTAMGRARMFQWISAANDYFYADIVVPLATAETPDSGVAEVARSLLQPVDRTLAAWPYLAGDELSLADLFVLPMLFYAEQALDDAQLFAPLPDLFDWLDRLRKRPGVANTEA